MDDQFTLGRLGSLLTKYSGAAYPVGMLDAYLDGLRRSHAAIQAEIDNTRAQTTVSCPPPFVPIEDLEP